MEEEGAEAEDAENQRQRTEKGKEIPRVFRAGVERNSDDDVPQGDAEEKSGKEAAGDEGRLPQAFPRRVRCRG